MHASGGETETRTAGYGYPTYTTPVQVLAFLSALLMLASSERVLGRLVHGAAARTTVLLGLTLLSSVAFYPAMYLGAALGNSRPIVYAQPGNTRLG